VESVARGGGGPKTKKGGPPRKIEEGQASPASRVGPRPTDDRSHHYAREAAALTAEQPTNASSTQSVWRVTCSRLEPARAFESATTPLSCWIAHGAASGFLSHRTGV